MQAEGVRAGQVAQVRGFADQHLRLPKEPEDPSNRRISLIVQYVVNGNSEKDLPNPLTRLGMQSGDKNDAWGLQLRVSDRTEAVATAMRSGLLSGTD
jgi:hypothetical protein